MISRRPRTEDVRYHENTSYSILLLTGASYYELDASELKNAKKLKKSESESESESERERERRRSRNSGRSGVRHTLASHRIPVPLRSEVGK